MIMVNHSSERSFNQSRYVGVVDLLRSNEDIIEILVHNQVNIKFEKFSVASGNIFTHVINDRYL